MQYRPLTWSESIDHRQRLEDARQGVHLVEPKVPATYMSKLLGRLIKAEMGLASPDMTLEGYKNGVATEPDQAKVVLGASNLLISSEHATTHFRKNSTGERLAKQPDTGTAALGAVVAAELKAFHATMVGRQTSDANHDEKHPFKPLLVDLMRSHDLGAFVSFHGMRSGHIASLDDERSFDVAVGVGSSPNEATLKLGQCIVDLAKRYGLKAAINQPFLRVTEEDGEYKIRLKNDGEIYPITFAAAGPNTTRTAIQQYGQDAEQEVAAVQIEMADTLRVSNYDAPPMSERAKTIGPYLGYSAMVEALYMSSRVNF